MLNTSVASFSLIEINVGNLWEVIAAATSGRNAEWIGVSKYTEAITEAVTKRQNDKTLAVSVGTADFLTPWLTRLYSELGASGQPKFTKLVVKHLKFELAKKLEDAGVLEQNFTDKLRLNLQTLQNDPGIKTNGLSVEFQEWQQLPFFHGYLIGEEFLIGNWQVGYNGYLHVRTPLYRSTSAKLPSVHRYIQSQFDCSGD